MKQKIFRGQRVVRPLQIRTATSALALGLVATLGLAACGGSSGGSGTSSGAVDRSATLRFGVTSIPANFDPHLAPDASMNKVYYLLWDRLMMLSADGAAVPGLAEKWDFSADGKTLTLHLRKGAKFHDGSAVDATSVKASLERAKTLTGSTMAAPLTSISSVDAVDTSTVALNLSGGGLQLPVALATGAGSVINAKCIDDAKGIATDPTDCASGPYTLDSFTPKQSAVLVRSKDEYWDNKAGQFAKVKFTAYLDGSAAAAGLKSGTEDMINTLLSSEDNEAAVKGTDLVHTKLVGLGTLSVFIDPRVVPVDDQRVRQAIVMGIDRSKVAAGIFGSEYATTQLFGKGKPGHIDGYDPLPYDPAKAKALLKEAGYGNGLELSLLIVAGQFDGESGSLAIQQQLKEIGITIKIVKVSPQETIAAWQSDKYAIHIGRTVGDRFPYNIVNRNGFTVYKLVPASITDRLTAQMNASVDPASSEQELETATTQMIKDVGDQATFNPVAWRQIQFLSQPWVLNVDTMPNSKLSDTGVDIRYLAVAKR